MLDDPGIGFPHRHAGEVLHLGDEAPVVVHRVVDLETSLAPEIVVLLAVAGRDVNETCTRVHRHEICGEHRHLAVDPRVLADRPLEIGSGYGERRDRGSALARTRAEGRRPREDAR
jgi:hypothetical protein